MCVEAYAEGGERPHAAGYQSSSEPKQQPDPRALALAHLPPPVLHQDLAALLAPRQAPTP